MLKALSPLPILNLRPDIFGPSGKRLDKETKINFKIHDVTDWVKIN